MKTFSELLALLQANRRTDKKHYNNNNNNIDQYVQLFLANGKCRGSAKYVLRKYRMHEYQECH